MVDGSRSTSKQEEFQVHNAVNHLGVFIQVLDQKRLVENEQNDISKNTDSVGDQVNATVKGLFDKLLIDQLNNKDFHDDKSKRIPDNQPVYSSTRAEDESYNVLGIFGVSKAHQVEPHMVLIQSRAHVGMIKKSLYKKIRKNSTITAKNDQIV